MRGLLADVFSHAEGWNQINTHCRLGRLDATHDVTELRPSITTVHPFKPIALFTQIVLKVKCI